MKFTDLIEYKETIIPLQKKLQSDQNDIYIWGIGALARNVYQYCKHYKIPVKGCYVNTSITSNAYFEELPIYYSLEEICRKSGNLSIIVAHSNYEEGIHTLEKSNSVKEIYCISSICCENWECIEKKFIDDRQDDLNWLYDNLGDRLSKKCMLSYFESRINDDASYMFPYFEKNLNYFRNDIIKLTQSETLLDVGACVGTAIWSFVDAVDGQYNSIIALEPEKENCEQLERNVKDRKIDKFILKKACAYNRDGYVKFSGDKEQGGIKNNTVDTFTIYPTVRIDSLFKEVENAKDISIIKINFPFSVPEILEGANQLIKNKKPRIVIRIGFDEHVMLDIILKIKELNPEYRFYFRYSIGIPQGLTLFAI